ncbi:hypothetical protein OBB02_00910 [Candidatus Puniceispirillum sp.]|nr:hypothetical protein [Candidatus Puniceispirillum sp.]
MTISDQEKIRIGATLDFCWWLNINAQMKCQEIFQALNRAWNNHHAERREEGNSLVVTYDDADGFIGNIEDAIIND